MTRDEIIKLVRETADPTIADPIGGEDETVLLQMHEVERLIVKVAATEREACAKVCEARGAEEFGMAYEGIALDCAERIRARGESWRETNRQTGETT